MNKEIMLGSKGRKDLVKGVNKVANAVKVTLGAKGRNVIIEDEMGRPHITKDGVTVARSINLSNKAQNLGASLVKEAAQKTVEMAGDATTTTVVLVQEMIKRGVKAIDNGSDPMSLKRGMDKATVEIVNEIKKLSKPVKGRETLTQIASISANNDVSIGRIISEAVTLVGEDGIINVEESQTMETTISVLDGMKIDRGYISPYFVTNEEKMLVEYNNPIILLYDKKISKIMELKNVLELHVKLNNRPLVIIAEDIEGEALQGLLWNNQNQKITCTALRCPGFGQSRIAMMEDIAILTGGTYVTETKGLTLANITEKHFGSCEKITSYNAFTVITGGKGEKEDVAKRTSDLKTQELLAKNPHEKESLKDRAAKLNNAIAVIKVGGVTESEIKEKKDRYDDALCATVAAMEEGFVIGGGSTLLHASRVLDKLKLSDKDEAIGVDIIRLSIMAPFKQILKNAGTPYVERLSLILLSKYGMGFNVKSESVEDLFKSGIIDPTKVVRVALENANSIAGIMLTTEGVIYTKID